MADDLLEVGRIGRPHGVTGELYVDLVTDRSERVAVGARLRVAGAADRWLVVEASRPSSGRWLVRFEGVDDRAIAERLVNSVVLAVPLHDPDELWVHELIGAKVVEVDGTQRGTCVAVVANPAHELLELDNGALVPVTFVVSLESGIVTIDPPEGLFEQ